MKHAVKPPITYQQYRKWYHRALQDLGHSYYCSLRFKNKPHTFDFARDIYRLVGRVRRLQAQLDAEFDAVTASCADAIMEMLKNTKD